MACYWLRDRDGFCHLTNRCWDGKPCPATAESAERARQALISEILKRLGRDVDRSRIVLR